MKTQSKTDWERVKREAAADAPVEFDPEAELPNPNDAAAVKAAWDEGGVTRRGRPPVAVKRPTLNMRIDADVLAHLRGLGRGWQTKVNALLRDAVNHGKL